MGMPGWCYLANLCNSTIIEIYGDIIRVSHGFDGCQMLEYIAVNQNSDSEIVVELLFLNPKYLCVLYTTLQPEHQTDCCWSIFFV